MSLRLCLVLALAVSLTGAQTPQETTFTSLLKAIEADDFNTAKGFYDTNPTMYLPYCGKTELAAAGWDSRKCMSVATGSGVTDSLKSSMTNWKMKFTIDKKWSGKKDGQPSFLVQGKIDITGKGSPIPSSVTCTNYFFYVTKFSSNNKLQLFWDFSDPKASDACGQQIAKAVGQSGATTPPGPSPFQPTTSASITITNPSTPPAAMTSVNAYINAFKTLDPAQVDPTVADNIQPTYVLQALTQGKADKKEFMAGLTVYLKFKYVEFTWDDLEIWPTDDANMVWIRLFPIGYLAGAPSNGTYNYINHYFMGFHIDSNKKIDQEYIVYNTYVAERSDDVLAKYQCLSCDLKSSLTFAMTSPCKAFQALASCYTDYTKLQGSPCLADLNKIKAAAKTAGCTIP